MVPDDRDAIVGLLTEALGCPAQRAQLIREFQQRVWAVAQPPGDESRWEILRDLAYDLDFYEADPRRRAEDPSYYGDDRLEEELRSTLEKLRRPTTAAPPRS